MDAQLVRHGLDEAEADVETETVARPRQALRRVGAGQPLPDLVVLDMDLGGHSGLDLLAQLREAPGMDRVPVIVLTGSEDPWDIEAAKRAGAATYYVKPKDLDGFLALGRELKVFWVDRAESVRP